MGATYREGVISHVTQTQTSKPCESSFTWETVQLHPNGTLKVRGLGGRWWNNCIHSVANNNVLLLHLGL